MLMISRRTGERVFFVVSQPGCPPLEIELLVKEIDRGSKVRLGIVAPDCVRVWREEIKPQEPPCL